MRPVALLFLLALPAASEAVLLDKIGARLGVDITVADKNLVYRWVGGRLVAKAPTPAEWRPFATLLDQELRPYSRTFVKKTHLKRIVLCRDLRFGGQNRSAVPDFARGILYLDCQQNRGRPVFSRRVIHHEYFHMVDKIDDGKLFEDNTWQKLNPAGFKYGKGGHTMRDPKAALSSTGSPGFLNRYCTSGVAEDKAEVFAYMMVEYRHVEARAETDAVIRKKMARMKALVKAFCKDLDDGFWKARRKASK